MLWHRCVPLVLFPYKQQRKSMQDFRQKFYITKTDLPDSNYNNVKQLSINNSKTLCPDFFNSSIRILVQSYVLIWLWHWARSPWVKNCKTGKKHFFALRHHVKQPSFRKLLNILQISTAKVIDCAISSMNKILLLVCCGCSKTVIQY